VCDESYSGVTEVSVEAIFTAGSQYERVFEASDASYLSGVHLWVWSSSVDKAVQISVNGVVYDIPPASGWGGVVEYGSRSIDLPASPRYVINVVTQLVGLDRVEVRVIFDFNRLVNVCVDCHGSMCVYSRLVTIGVEKYEIPPPTITPTPVQQLPLPLGKVALSIIVSGGGTTDPRPGVYQYDRGSTVTIKAIPYAGYVFNFFLVDGERRTENPVTITLDKDTIVNVSFTTTPVSPTVTPTPIPQPVPLPLPVVAPTPAVAPALPEAGVVVPPLKPVKPKPWWLEKLEGLIEELKRELGGLLRW
jgi:hypothetical protein